MSGRMLLLGNLWLWSWMSLLSCDAGNGEGGEEGENSEFIEGVGKSFFEHGSIEPDSWTSSQGVVDHDPIRYAWIESRDHKVEVPFQIRSGYAVMDGDVLLGRPSEFTQHARSVVRVYRPWKCSTVFYNFSTDSNFQVDGKNRQTVRMAIQHFENRTGLQFVYLQNPGPHDDYIEIRQWKQSWGNSYVGMRGGKQELNLPLEASLRLVIHEFGHAVGLSHEHQHPQRDRYVFFDESCVKPSQRGNFRLQTEVEFSDFYDFASVMHYKSSGFCMNDIKDLDGDGKRKECGYQEDDPLLEKCYPLLRLAGECPERACEDRDGDGFREYLRGGDRLSTGDIAAVARLYRGMISHHKRGYDDAFNDGFGKSIVVGDFDGDSISDVAVGAPKLSEEIFPSAVGKVVVYRGYSSGFVRCRELQAQDFDLKYHASDDSSHSRVSYDRYAQRRGNSTTSPARYRFGMTLAVADFDHDGIDDLAIASTENNIQQREKSGPGYSDFDDPTHGVVYIYRSRDLEGEDERSDLSRKKRDRRGVRLQPWTTLVSRDWSGEPHQQDHFGYAMATGDLDGDGWKDDLVIGAPTIDGDTIAKTGSAMVVYGDREQLELGEKLKQNSIGTVNSTNLGGMALRLPVQIGHEDRGDEFGTTIAVGDINGDVFDEVFVGAPCDRVYQQDCAGAVFVFGREYRELSAWMRIDQRNLARSEIGDRFGHSIALIDMNEDGRKELLVGTPGEDIERVNGRIDQNAGDVFAIRVGRYGYRLEPTIAIPWWKYVGPGTQLGRTIVAMDAESNHHSDWRLWVSGVSQESPVSRASLFGWRSSHQRSRASVGSGKIEAISLESDSNRIHGASALAVVKRADREFLLVGSPGLFSEDPVSTAKAKESPGQVYVYRIDQRPIKIIDQLRSDRNRF